MKENPVQFAVVREDPLTEANIVRARGCQHALLIASGGCTALSLKALIPKLAITVVDPNPAQLDLVRRKRRAVAEGHRAQLNIGSTDRTGLNACGNFEGLFAGLRHFVEEFAMPRAELRTMFEPEAPMEIVESLLRSRYWPVAFDLFFSDALLRTMFGDAAIQHAVPGSYPRYFQRAFERGLRRSDRTTNYFLHHVLLGAYLDRDDCLPPYLAAPGDYAFDTVEGFVSDVPALDRFDFISLSNITDWMDRDDIEALGADLRRHCRPGTTLLLRQLNNQVDLSKPFSGFRPDLELADELWTRDRSLFYARFIVATKESP
ncbi:MAG: DUF3419 family protein [Myxococcota bacterium]